MNRVSHMPVIVLLACLVVSNVVSAGTLWLGAYDPGLGTVPEDQGWSLLDNDTSQPTPFVAAGVLHQGLTSHQGFQCWDIGHVSDFTTSAGLVVELTLRVDESTYAVGGAPGTWRTGHMILATDLNARVAALGIADTGIRISSHAFLYDNLSSAFIPLDTTSTPRTYRLTANASGLTIAVDGIVVASLPLGAPNSHDTPNEISFADRTSGGKSKTELELLRWGEDVPDAVWVDLGFALAGTAGEPMLVGSGSLIAEQLTTLALSQALPGSVTTLVIGITRVDLPFKGGTLVPAPSIVLGGLPVDQSGTLLVTFPWPAGIPTGLTAYYQHWITDPSGPQGFAASNAVSGTTP